MNSRKNMNMKLHRYVLVVAALLTMPACDQKAANQKDGVKDALDTRPNEALRDAGEDTGDAIKDAGRDVKDAVQDK
jgi:hypothetical protein